MKVINRINPFDMAVLLGLFEGFALFFLAVGLRFTSNLHFFVENVVLGVFVGLFCTFFAVFVWRLLRPTLRLNLNNEQIIITNIFAFKAGVANACFLVVLFVLEDFIFSIKGIPFVGVAVFGLVGTGVSVAVLAFLYNSQPFKLEANVGRLEKISPIKVGIVAGLFEAIILPVMSFIMVLPGSVLLMYSIAGLISGLVGGFVGSVIFNFISSMLKVKIEIE